MKRIRTINGYSIYESRTARDEENYSCEIGNYNIYIATDIRDFGLTCSYPEWDNIDSLATAIELCSGSNHAVAVALADELSSSTIQDMDLTLEIEQRLDMGYSVNYIRECWDEETEVLYTCVSDKVSAQTPDEERALLVRAMDAAGYDYDESDSYYYSIRFVCRATDMAQYFDGWQDIREWLEGVVFDDPEVSDAVERILHPERFTEPSLADQNLDYDHDETDRINRAMCAAGYSYQGLSHEGYLCFEDMMCEPVYFVNWPAARDFVDGLAEKAAIDEDRLYDEVHARFDERDYHDRARFTARMAEIADELGLTQEQVDGFTSDWELWYEASVPVYHSNALLEEGLFHVDPSLEKYREELAAGIGSEITCDTIEECGIWGRAVLEIGHADIEVNITRPEGNHIVADYFVCLQQEDGDWFEHGYIDQTADIDWLADNWQDLLHDHMRHTLLELSAYDPDMDFSTPFVDTEYAAWAGLYAAEQCPVEEEPKPERKSHASYYVVRDDEGDYMTRTVPFEGDARQHRYAFFRTVANQIAFNDCSYETVEEIVYDGEPCHYTGWQPGMVIEFASDITGEIVYSGSFPEWDH